MLAPRILLKRTWRGSGSSPHSSLEKGIPECLKRLRSCSFRLQRSHRPAGPGPRDVVYCGNSSLASSASCRALKRPGWGQRRHLGRAARALGSGGAGRTGSAAAGIARTAHDGAADLPNPMKKGDACPRPGRRGFKVKAHTQSRQTVQPLAWEAWRVHTWRRLERALRAITARLMPEHWADREGTACFSGDLTAFSTRTRVALGLALGFQSPRRWSHSPGQRRG